MQNLVQILANLGQILAESCLDSCKILFRILQNLVQILAETGSNSCRILLSNLYKFVNASRIWFRLLRIRSFLQGPVEIYDESIPDSCRIWLKFLQNLDQIKTELRSDSYGNIFRFFQSVARIIS